MNNFDTLIFDFGGVLYNIDYYETTRELSKLSSKPDILNSLTHLKILDLPAQFEKGNISEKSFRNYLRNEYFIDSSDYEIDKAWNAMLLGIKHESFDFIYSLRQKYRLVLLSNTNSIHYDYFINECSQLMNLFDHVLLSYKIGMRKPDLDIYQYALQISESLAEKTLFIDDSEPNIRGAEMANMHTYHFTPDKQLSDLLHSI